MSKSPGTFDKGADRSILAYGALMAGFASMLVGGFGLRSYREEKMIHNMPHISATVLSYEYFKGKYVADIAFDKNILNDITNCKARVNIPVDHKNLHIGSTVQIIAPNNSCYGPVVVGPRYTVVLLSFSGAFILISLIQAVLAAQSMSRPRHTNDNQ
ncbi:MULTISPECIES: hypothetical protein [Methylobacterium]|uniref:hypothetical protein n=1 Tax=Methylobacterium TaxID=407 RepID=UPI0013EC8B8E|nr:hypothetical protein [Methylobacterium sp. DB0501]NGM38690.1 hypothetical protein [Methylobacterium sp. DB0501]